MYSIVEIQKTVKNIAETLPISKVVLIGSYARNEATEQSDIDLVIDGADLSDAYWDFLFGMEDNLSVKVDIMTARGVKNSCFHDNVSMEGIIFYET